MGDQSNDAKAREIARVLGRRIRQRVRDRGAVAEGGSDPRPQPWLKQPIRPRSSASNGTGGRRYSPVRIQGEPLSSTILRDRGTY